jgi:hypothetical protein
MDFRPRRSSVVEAPEEPRNFSRHVTAALILSISALLCDEAPPITQNRKGPSASLHRIMNDVSGEFVGC